MTVGISEKCPEIGRIPWANSDLLRTEGKLRRRWEKGSYSAPSGSSG